MRHTLACSFHKGAGRLPVCSVQPRAERLYGEPRGRFRNRREENDSPHPQYAARCRLTITESPFFAIPTLIFFIPERDRKDSEFFCSDHFFNRPGQSRSFVWNPDLQRVWYSFFSLTPGTRGDGPAYIDLVRSQPGMTGGPGPFCRMRLSHTFTVSPEPISGHRCRRSQKEER